MAGASTKLRRGGGDRRRVAAVTLRMGLFCDDYAFVAELEGVTPRTSNGLDLYEFGLPAARFSCNSHPTLVDPDTPSNVAEIDEGWDDVDRPAETSTTAPTKPATVIAVATPTPPIARPSSRDDKAATKAAKIAKKNARLAARQAERRAREQSNNRAARKAVASREAKRTAQISSAKQSRPRSGDERNARHASSPAARPQVAKTAGALRTMIPLVVAAIAVLAALGWFLWMRGS